MMRGKVRSLIAGGLLWACLIASPSVAAGQQKPPNDTLLADAVALYNKGEFDKALEKFEEALKRDPNSVPVLYGMARTWYGKKDYAKVIEIAQRGARFDHPLRPELHVLIGNALDELGKTDEAIATFKTAIRENPNLAEATSTSASPR